MIKFNNFPPTKAGDVELTLEGFKEIRRATQDDGVSYETQSAALSAYGKSIGMTILTAVNGNRHVMSDVIAPILRDVHEITLTEHAHPDDFWKGALDIPHIPQHLQRTGDVVQ